MYSIQSMRIRLHDPVFKQTIRYEIVRGGTARACQSNRRVECSGMVQIVVSLFEHDDVTVATLVHGAHVLLDVPLPFARAYTHGTLEFAFADRVRIVASGDESEIGLRDQRGQILGVRLGIAL